MIPYFDFKVDWKSIIRLELNYSLIFSGDPDRIDRHEMGDIIKNGGNDRNDINKFGRNSISLRSGAKNKKKNSNATTTPRRREVLLSKISVYIVYMFVCCHRYVLHVTKILNF